MFGGHHWTTFHHFERTDIIALADAHRCTEAPCHVAQGVDLLAHGQQPFADFISQDSGGWGWVLSPELVAGFFRLGRGTPMVGTPKKWSRNIMPYLVPCYNMQKIIYLFSRYHHTVAAQIVCLKFEHTCRCSSKPRSKTMSSIWVDVDAHGDSFIP